MLSSRRVMTTTLILGLGILLISCVTRLQAWQAQTNEQTGNVESLTLASESTQAPPVTEIATEEIVTATPFPPEWPINTEGTPFNPFELTPILIVPVVNAEGTPLTPTPSDEDFLTATPVPLPTSTPLIVANTVDLAVGLADDEIWLIAVLRTDGYIDEYRIPATQVLPLNSVADIERYRAYRDTLFHLKPGEEILAEGLLTTPERKGVPISPEDRTSTAETPTPLTTADIDVPSQSDDPVPLYLPHVEN